MIGLPNIGERVRVWPFPGNQAQLDERPLDARGGGRAVPVGGMEVVWSEFQHSQLLQGMILLHAPPCEKHELAGGVCKLCGRTAAEAKEYDAERDAGIKAAKEARATLPLHPMEAAALERKKEAEAAELAAKQDTDKNKGGKK